MNKERGGDARPNDNGGNDENSEMKEYRDVHMMEREEIERSRIITR